MVAFDWGQLMVECNWISRNPYKSCVVNRFSGSIYPWKVFFPKNLLKQKYQSHLKYFFITTHRDNAALNFILADNNKTTTEEGVCSAHHQTTIVGTPNSICFGVWELSLEGLMWYTYTYLDPLRLSEGELPRPAAADVSESIKAFTLRGVFIGVLISFLSVAPTTQVKILQTYNWVTFKSWLQ